MEGTCPINETEGECLDYSRTNVCGLLWHIWSTWRFSCASERQFSAGLEGKGASQTAFSLRIGVVGIRLASRTTCHCCLTADTQESLRIGSILNLLSLDMRGRASPANELEAEYTPRIEHELER